MLRLPSGIVGRRLGVESSILQRRWPARGGVDAGRVLRTRSRSTHRTFGWITQGSLQGGSYVSGRFAVLAPSHVVNFLWPVLFFQVGYGLRGAYFGSS